MSTLSIAAPATERRAATSSRNINLDGLRGLALLLVFAYHTCSSDTPQFHDYCNLPALAAPVRALVWLAGKGWAGVDLFFVLSGFLITGILLDARGSRNYFRVFYFRRALRIFPIYYLSLLFLFAVVPTHYGWREQMWYWFNISNLHSAFHPQSIPTLTHFWTLAVEEQFYLVWPWVVSRCRSRRLFLISLGGIAAAIILRNLPAVQGLNLIHDNFIYRLTPFRVDSLLFGALLAIAIKRGLQREGSLKWILGALGVGTGLVAFAMRDAAGMARYGLTGFALIASGLVLLCALWGDHRSVAFFRLRPLCELGRYSYCIYVIQLFVIVVVGHAMRHRLFSASHPYASLVAVAGLELCVCYGLARLSWELIEGPALSLKRLMRYQRNHATPYD
jgi:peptidoglycan/LPS O-acetylase OafA/YrhL